MFSTTTLKRFAMILGFFSSVAFAQTPDDAVEGVDVESPQQIEQARQRIEREFGNAIQPEMMTPAYRANIIAKYAFLDPKHEVPTDLLEAAVTYYDANLDKFPNPNYITIVNFKPRSDRYRFFLVDMKTGAVEKYHTTHGKKSDPKNSGYATKFSNVISSAKSSLGFVRTAEAYDGTYKHAVRLDGLSTTNSNIRARAVVFHGWDGVKEANVIQKMSAGCITLDWTVKDAVLEKIKEGSLMYVGVSKKAK
jgi:hypothetical protein